MTRDNAPLRWTAAITMIAVLTMPGAATAAPDPAPPLIGDALKAQATVLEAMGLNRPGEAGISATQSPGDGYYDFGDRSPLVAGDAHTCAAPLGAIWCWGANDAGQLGNGTTDSTTAGVRVDLDSDGLYSVALVAGRAHTCAIAHFDDNAMHCWGANDEGQLGDGGTTASPDPVPVTEAVAAAAGAEHTCVVEPDATVSCWGRNDLGQLGTGTAGGSESTPQAVTGLTEIRTIAAEENTTCAIDVNGSAWCWGSDADGQLGDGNGGTPAPQPTPVAVDLTDVPEDGFRDITVGLHHACAVTYGDELYCWGSDAAGQLGTGGAAGDQSSPVAVDTDGRRIGSADAGGDSTCAVADTGDLVCWGANGDGQLGTGDSTDRAEPTAADLSQVTPAPIYTELLGDVLPMLTSVTMGAGHGCAVDLTPSVYCWGANADGQLGNGGSQGSDVPRITRLSPGPATGVTLTAGDETLAVRWAAPADPGVAPVEQYAALSLDDDGGFHECSEDTDTHCDLEDLENDTAYTVFIGVATAAGISYSAGVTGTPVAAGAGGGLPVSGPDVVLYLLSAGALIGVGLAIMAAARRRTD